jgi:protein-tyrosine phosphatase
MKRVLFLCTGNYYRSRFSEIFFNWHAEQRDLRWRAESRGLALVRSNPGPISPYAVARLRHHGIPIDTYQRFPLDAANHDFESAAYIVAVKQTEHRPLVEARFSSWLERVEFWEVHDLDCAGPEEAMPHLECEVMGLIERLAARTGSTRNLGA